MMDAIFKRLFGHPEVVKHLIRHMLQEEVERIDLSTLEKFDSELIGDALVRRYPDMIWTARTRDGTGTVVFPIEFQGRRDRLMALRTTIYAHLAVQQLLERAPPSLRPESIEVWPPLVVYHGPGAWEDPTELDELFPRGIPRDFSVMFRGSGGSGSGTALELVESTLIVYQNLPMEGILDALRTLRRIAEETDADLDRILAESTGAWLVLMEAITEKQNREATTMAQVVTEYERSLEEFGRKRQRRGRAEGRAEGMAEGMAEGLARGRAEVLCRLAGRRFGSEAGERLAEVLGTPPDSKRLSVAEAAVLECSTAEELLRRVRGSSGD